MSVGKPAGHARTAIATIGGTRASSSNAAAVPGDGRPHVGHQPRERVVVEGRRRPVEQVVAALVVDRCRRDAGLDELDPAPVDHLVVGRGRHGDRPAEVVGDAETHDLHAA